MSAVIKCVLIVLLRNGVCQQENKRLLDNNVDATEARFRQLEITIQNLKSQLSEVNQMKTSITNLNNEIKTKDIQIRNLSATVSALQNKGNGEVTSSNVEQTRANRTNWEIYTPQDGVRAHITVAFTAVLTKSVSIGPHQTVIFDKVINNLGNGYDVNVGQFIAPFSGIYIISATVFSSGSTTIHTEVVKNGVQMAAMYCNDEDDAGHTLSLVLNQNDKVWIRHFEDTDIRSLYARSDRYYCSFSGALLVAL